jgi:hypothetical protein
MQVDTYVGAACADLARVAAVGDESTARAAELLTVALESSLARRLQEALAEAALELSSQLDDAHVEVRIAGNDLSLVHVPQAPADPAEPSKEGPDARITLRLPESLKDRVEAAAGSERTSVNNWLVQAIGRALDSRRPRGDAHRLTGYGRS